MKHKIYFLPSILLFFLVLFHCETKAQFVDPFDSLKNSMESDFDKFLDKTEKEFSEFVIQNEKEFSELLRKAWKEYELVQDFSPDSTPKPTELPKIEPVEIQKDKPQEIVIKIPKKDTTNYTPIPVIPNLAKEEKELVVSNNLHFKFYGVEVNILYDPALNFDIKQPLNNKSIANFWDKVTDCKHYNLINQINAYKEIMNLNDWGYFEFVNQISKKISSNTNSARTLSWVLMLKSGFKIKIGYLNNTTYLLVPSANKLYGKRYYQMEGVRYYILNEDAQSIQTYPGNYPEARRIFDFNMYEPVILGTNVSIRAINFNYIGKEYELKINYNSDLVAFFENYPQGDVKIHFDAAISPDAKHSLVENLEPILKGRSQQDAVNFLLRMIQTGFDYKTDPEQFGREKFFFAEELFYYPYCDCEDRSILFAYLVNKLLKLKVVGVKYPGHIATAVLFDQEIKGDYFIYEGEKYFICDPTYINAPAGMCMPAYQNHKGEVIPLRNSTSLVSFKNKVWNVLYASGGECADKSNSMAIDGDGNAYVTGYFYGEKNFTGKKIWSVNNTNDAFLAKFDSDANLIWMRTLGGSGNDLGLFVGLDKDDNCFVSGTFDGDFKTISQKLESNNRIDVFVVKYDKDGNELWSNKFDMTEKVSEEAFIYVAKFSDVGSHTSTVLFNYSDNYSDYGITFKNSECYISILASGQNSTKQENINTRSFIQMDKKLSNMTKLMVFNDYEKAVAGIFAFIETIGSVGTTLDGKDAQMAVNTYNPSFKTESPSIYTNLGKIASMKNTGGIITISTRNREDIYFADLRIKNNAKLKITTFPDGNSKINILSGASIGKASITFDVNFVKLIKTTGDLLIDYDSDHSQKRLNVKKDML